MAMKQHELIAVEGDVKKQIKRQQTDLYHLLQKGELFFGMEKVYSPLDEEGVTAPKNGWSAYMKFVVNALVMFLLTSATRT